MRCVKRCFGVGFGRQYPSFRDSRSFFDVFDDTYPTNTVSSQTVINNVVRYAVNHNLIEEGRWIASDLFFDKLIQDCGHDLPECA